MALQDFSRQFADRNGDGIIDDSDYWWHPYGNEPGQQMVSMTFSPNLSSNSTRNNAYAVNNTQASLIFDDVAQKIKDGERYKNFRLEIKRRDILGPDYDVVAGASVFSH